MYFNTKYAFKAIFITKCALKIKIRVIRQNMLLKTEYALEIKTCI